MALLPQAVKVPPPWRDSQATLALRWVSVWSNLQLSRRWSAERWWWLAIAACALLLVFHARSFLPFMADDSFISLRYSQRLLDGKGLTWTDGERVEGYSNLTWVLACALLGALGLDLVLAARVVAALATAATCAAIVYAFYPRRFELAWGAVVALLGLALCSPIAVWAVGGLEQPLVAALAAWTIALLVYAPAPRKSWPPCLLLALLALSRPDGVMVAGLITFGVLLSRGFNSKHCKDFALQFGSALAAMLAQLAFRRFYYDDWVPNPARIKLALSLTRLEQGAEYVWAAATALAPSTVAFMAALGVFAFQRDVRARLLPSVGVVLGWTAYLVFIGGDIFPGRRHIVLPAAMAAFALAELFNWLRTKVRPASFFTLGAVYAVVLAALQTNDAQAQRARRERWEWHGKKVGQMLKHAFEDKAPLLAVDPAGCLPYFSQLPSLDMLGLNDRHIAHHPPPSVGTGKLAHEFGDGKYVLSRAPDLVLFCSPWGSEVPCFLGGAQMKADRGFRQTYRLVTFETSGKGRVRSRIWVHTGSPKLGVVRHSKRIDVPGYLLAQNGATVRAREKSLVSVASKSKPARFQKLRLDAGKYELDLRANGLLNVKSTKSRIERRNGQWLLVVPKQASVNLTFAPETKQKVEIEHVTLRRVRKKGR